MRIIDGSGGLVYRARRRLRTPPLLPRFFRRQDLLSSRGIWSDVMSPGAKHKSPSFIMYIKSIVYYIPNGIIVCSSGLGIMSYFLFITLPWLCHLDCIGDNVLMDKDVCTSCFCSLRYSLPLRRSSKFVFCFQSSLNPAPARLLFSHNLSQSYEANNMILSRWKCLWLLFFVFSLVFILTFSEYHDKIWIQGFLVVLSGAPYYVFKPFLI